MRPHPFPLAKWHYHPEYELHLIRETSGKMFVGDYVGNFEPGVFVLTGPNLPHNWVSDIAPGEVMKDRDMLIQFSDGVLREMMRVNPELEEINPLLDDAVYGIEFSGEDARVGAELLRQIGRASPTRRMLFFLELLDLLNRSERRKILSSHEYSPTLDHDVSELINKAIDFLIRNLTEDVRLSDVARSCGMSDSAFSRFFKKNTGHGFVRDVNRMRVNRACTLLAQTATPITDICFDIGFNNLSNSTGSSSPSAASRRRSTGATRSGTQRVQQSFSAPRGASRPIRFTPARPSLAPTHPNREVRLSSITDGLLRPNVRILKCPRRQCRP